MSLGYAGAESRYTLRRLKRRGVSYGSTSAVGDEATPDPWVNLDSLLSKPELVGIVMVHNGGKS